MSLAAVALPASAAAETFAGKTQQGKPVTIKTGPDGELRKASWRWSTTSCDQGNLRLRTQATVLKTPKRSKPGFFTAKGAYKSEFTDATIRFRIASTGRQRSPTRWSGTFKAEATVNLEDGPTVDCGLRRIGWAATADPKS